MAFDSWLGGKLLILSKFSVLFDKGDVVFLLFGDFDPSVGTFFAFGEFNLRHCGVFDWAFVVHLAAACFFGDILSSLLASVAFLEFRLQNFQCGKMPKYG